MTVQGNTDLDMRFNILLRDRNKHRAVDESEITSLNTTEHGIGDCSVNNTEMKALATS